MRCNNTIYRPIKRLIRKESCFFYHLKKSDGDITMSINVYTQFWKAIFSFCKFWQVLTCWGHPPLFSLSPLQAGNGPIGHTKASSSAKGPHTQQTGVPFLLLEKCVSIFFFPLLYRHVIIIILLLLPSTRIVIWVDWWAFYCGSYATRGCYWWIWETRPEYF